jgi:hypothetical protein
LVWQRLFDFAPPGEFHRYTSPLIMTEEHISNEPANQQIVEHMDEVFEFRQSLSDETDRGCALMAAAYLDSELQKLLSKYCVNNPNVQKDIFGRSRSLSTFSSRIDMSYLLGLLGPNAHRDLHLIRKVRNEFAHVASPIDFNDPGLAQRCDELYHDAYGKPVPPRKKFMRVARGVLGIIHAIFFSISSIVEANDVSIEGAKKHMKIFLKTLGIDDDV